MPSAYPSAIDTFSNPASGDALNSASVPHAAQHANANDAIEAIEAKLGTGAGVRNTGSDSRFGAGADGGAGTFLRLGAAADANAYVLAEGTDANVTLHIRSKGTGGIEMESAAGADWVWADGAGEVLGGDTSLALRQNNALKRVAVGAVDSAGVGFRTLRIAN